MDDSGNTGPGRGQFFEKKYLPVMIYDHLSCPLRHKFGVFATCFGYQNVSLDSQFVSISNPWGFWNQADFKQTITLPKTNSSPLKMGHSKRKLDSESHPFVWRGELLVSWGVIRGPP